MAWADVPAKFEQYMTIDYGGAANATNLVRRYVPFDTGKAATLDNIPVDKREDFESDLDYQLGACKNLVTSRSWHPQPVRKL